MKLSELRDDKNKLIFSNKQQESLENAGIRTVWQLAMTGTRELKNIDGIGDTSINKGLAKAREILGIDGFMTAYELRELREKTVNFLTTGSMEVNKILKSKDAPKGGIATGTLTEIAGMNGAGKTQFCLQLSVNAQLPIEQGGLDGNVIYVDTEETCRPERIVQMAEAQGLDAEEVLKNIIVAHAYSSDHQVWLVDNCDVKIEANNVKLLIVDSLMTHWRSEYIGRDALSSRQQKLNQHIAKMRKLMIEYGLAVVYTNQVISSPDLFGGTKPIGGNIVGHAGGQRIYIRRPKRTSNKRIVASRKSPYIEDAEAICVIDESGVRDATK